MERKKLIALLLGLLWLILLTDRFFLSQKETPPPISEVKKDSLHRAASDSKKVSDITYPTLRLSITRKNLFSSPIQPIGEKQPEKETKKVITLPAPPLPILPEPKAEVKEPVVEKQDELKDVSLIGVLDKKTKKMAFIKYKKEIKPFHEGEAVFNTNFFVEKIGVNMVILKSTSKEERKLEIEKEEKDDKK